MLHYFVTDRCLFGSWGVYFYLYLYPQIYAVASGRMQGALWFFLPRSRRFLLLVSPAHRILSGYIQFLGLSYLQKIIQIVIPSRGVFFSLFFFFLCFSFVPLFFFSFIFSCKTYSSVCKIELFHFKQTYRTSTIVCAWIIFSSFAISCDSL